MDYPESAPPSRTPTDYWWNGADESSGLQDHSGQFQFQRHSTPEYVDQRGASNVGGGPSPPQFHIRRMLPPGYGVANAPSIVAPAHSESNNAQAPSKRGKK